MTTEERMQVLKTVVAQVKEQAPVINQIGALQMEEIVKMARYSEDYGADAISATTPLLYEFREEEIVDYYNYITKNSNLPLFVYNVPEISGLDLGFNFIRKLAENANIIGIKFSSYFQHEMLKMTEIRNGKFVVLSGVDEMFISALAIGIRALIGSFYGVIPELYLKMTECFENNRLEAARRLQSAGNEIIGAVYKYSFFPALKALLSWRGFECAICKRPFRALMDEEKSHLKDDILRIEDERKTGLAFFEQIAKSP